MSTFTPRNPDNSMYADPLVQAFHERFLADFEDGPPEPDDCDAAWLEWLAGLDAYIAQVAFEQGLEEATIELATIVDQLELPQFPGADVSSALGWQLLNLATLDRESTGFAEIALAYVAPWLPPAAHCEPGARFAAADVALRAAQRIKPAARAEWSEAVAAAARLVGDPNADRGDFVESWDGHIDDLIIIAAALVAPDVSSAIESIDRAVPGASIAARARALAIAFSNAGQMLKEQGQVLAAQLLRWGLSPDASTNWMTADAAGTSADTAGSAGASTEKQPRTVRTFHVLGSEALDGISLTARLVLDQNKQVLVVRAEWEAEDDASDGPGDREITVDLFVISEAAYLARYRFTGKLEFERARGQSWVADTEKLRDEEGPDDDGTTYVHQGDSVFLHVVGARSLR